VLTRPEDDSARIIDSISSEAYRRDAGRRGCRIRGRRGRKEYGFREFLEDLWNSDVTSVRGQKKHGENLKISRFDRRASPIISLGSGSRFNRGYDLRRIRFGWPTSGASAKPDEDETDGRITDSLACNKHEAQIMRRFVPLIKRNVMDDRKCFRPRDNVEIKTRMFSRNRLLALREKNSDVVSRERERTEERDFHFRRIALRWRCATSWTARCAPGTFPFFLSLSASGKRPRVHATKARACTRSRRPPGKRRGTRRRKATRGAVLTGGEGGGRGRDRRIGW